MLNSIQEPGRLGSVARRREFDGERGERVLAALRRRLVQHDGNILALSRELGVPQSGLWRTLHGVYKPTLGIAEAIAEVEGLTLESIVYSTRERAARIALEGGVPQAAIDRVMAEPEDASRGVLWYIDRMRAAASFFAAEPPPPSSAHPIAPARTPRRRSA